MKLILTLSTNVSSTIIYQNISGKKVSSKDLLRWGGEIASGMEFIGAKNVIFSFLYDFEKSLDKFR